MTAQAICGRLTQDGSRCSHPVGTARRCAAGHPATTIKVAALQPPAVATGDPFATTPQDASHANPFAERFAVPIAAVADRFAVDMAVDIKDKGTVGAWTARPAIIEAHNGVGRIIDTMDRTLARGMDHNRVRSVATGRLVGLARENLELAIDLASDGGRVRAIRSRLVEAEAILLELRVRAAAPSIAAGHGNAPDADTVEALAVEEFGRPVRDDELDGLINALASV